MRIEVESTATSTRSIKYSDRKTGQEKTLSVTEQNALLWRDGERYPERMILDVEEGKSAYPVGVYTLTDQSFVLNRYNKLQLRVELQKTEATKAA